jgi:hypothetical protein
MVVHLFFALTVSIRSRLLFPTLCGSINTKSMGVVVGILAYSARGCGFDPRTVQTFVCMNMSVCIGSGCFYVLYVWIYEKKYITIY